MHNLKKLAILLALVGSAIPADAQVNRRVCKFNGKAEFCAVNWKHRVAGVTWLSDGKQTIYDLHADGSCIIVEDNGRYTDCTHRFNGSGYNIRSARGNTTYIPY